MFIFIKCVYIVYSIIYKFKGVYMCLYMIFFFFLFRFDCCSFLCIFMMSIYYFVVDNFVFGNLNVSKLI